MTIKFPKKTGAGTRKQPSRAAKRPVNAVKKPSRAAAAKVPLAKGGTAKVAQTVASSQPVGKAKAVKKVATAARKPRIMSAPKGARTLTHSEIEQAVERVFAKRYGTNG